MGVGEPDFGELWASREAIISNGLPTFDMSHFLQPRVEGEVAFLLGGDLSGPGVTPAMVRAAAVAATLAVEVVDSRIADWRIQLVDTVADNASFGGFTLGGWSEQLLATPLERTIFTLTRGEEVMVSEPGSAVLGGPLLAVAWLADKLSSLGGGLSAGDVVLSGSFGAAVPAVAGDEFTLRGGDELPLTVQFVGS